MPPLIRRFVYAVALPSATRVASSEASCIFSMAVRTSPTPLTTAMNSSAIGGTPLNYLARLANGVINGE
jgi:hypothetical protein